MKATRLGALIAPFRRFRWRLILSYNLVTLVALFILGWWGLIAGSVYLQYAFPDETWASLFFNQVLPAFRVILPSATILVIPAVLVSAYFGFLNARWLDIRLANLGQAINAWQKGDFTIKVKDDVADEIGAFGEQLNQMAAKLQQLMQSHEDLATLEERNRLARDLHDAVKQQITAASFQVGAAKALLDKDQEATRSCLAEAEKLIHTAHLELNSIIFEMRPVTLKAGRLVESIADYLDGWARQNQITVRTTLHCDWNPGEEVQQNLLRVIQEALSNVARHSQAGQVEVRLECNERDAMLSIEDNGQGFEAGNAGQEGFGLKTMESRILSVGGVFKIESHAGQGTRVSAVIPLGEKSDER